MCQLNDFTAKAMMAPRRARYENPSAAPSKPAGPAGRPLPVLTFVYADQPMMASTAR